MGNESFVKKSVDELSIIFQDTGVVNSLKAANGLALSLNNVPVDYGDGFLMFVEKKE